MNPLLSNKMYDALKWAVVIFLPALATAIFALGNLWGFSNTELIVGSLVIFQTFMGALLGLSTKQYNNSESKYDGVLHIDSRDPLVDRWTIETTTPLEDLEQQDVSYFKIEHHD